MKGFSITGLCLVLLNTKISALDNGLALTPPMGWLTWERFRCNTDCERDPENCISERLIKEMADIMVSDGYKDVGYEYVIIDDCWLASERDQNGRLVPDPKRFPSGIKKLAEYVHKKGLKFGIYEDFGKKTCGGFPGSEFYMETDAKTFADWGVDYLKFDGCYSNLNDFQAGYEAMGFFLNKTGRKIVYSCEWPFYKLVNGLSVDFAAVRNTCNMWRNYFDIQDSWSSVIDIINFWGNNSKIFTKYAGPGGWNDPDMVNGIQIWCRKLSDNRTALAFLNENSDGMPRYLKVSLEDMKLSPTRPYNFTEAFEMKIHFIIAKEDHLEMYVNPHGVQLFIAKLM